MAESRITSILSFVSACRFRRYSTKFVNFWPLNRLFSREEAHHSIQMENTLQTAITLTPNAHGTPIQKMTPINAATATTVLLFNGKETEVMLELENNGTAVMADNGGGSNGCGDQDRDDNHHHHHRHRQKSHHSRNSHHHHHTDQHHSSANNNNSKRDSLSSSVSSSGTKSERNST